MISSKVRAAGGAVALTASGLGQLAQYAVAPAHISNGSAVSQVSAAAGQDVRMQLGLWFDLLILALVPAVLFLGELAGSRRSRLAATGTAVAFVGALGARPFSTPSRTAWSVTVLPSTPHLPCPTTTGALKASTQRSNYSSG